MDTIPPSCRFMKGLNDVYEVLIKGKSKESGGS